MRVRLCVTAKLPVFRPWFWTIILLKCCARFLQLGLVETPHSTSFSNKERAGRRRQKAWHSSHFLSQSPETNRTQRHQDAPKAKFAKAYHDKTVNKANIGVFLILYWSSNSFFSLVCQILHRARLHGTILRTRPCTEPCSLRQT